MTKQLIALVLLPLLLWVLPAAPAAADTWETFVVEAERVHGDAGRQAAEFLARHRPPQDEDLALDLLMENLDYALRARAEFPWGRALSDEMFLNDVLPYAVFDETREAWRAEMYERCRGLGTAPVRHANRLPTRSAALGMANAT